MRKLENSTRDTKDLKVADARQRGGILLGVRRVVYLLATLLVVALAMPWLINSSPIRGQVQTGIDLFLLQAGLGWFLLVLWVVGVLKAFNRAPGRAVRQLHRWLGALFLILVIVGSLSLASLEFMFLNRLWLVNWGGEFFGTAILGNPPAFSYIRLGGLAISGAMLIFPMLAWHLIRSMLGFLRILGRAFNKGYSRFRLHALVFRGLRFFVTRLIRGIVKLIKQRVSREVSIMIGERAVAVGGTTNVCSPNDGMDSNERDTKADRAFSSGPSPKFRQRLVTLGFQKLPSASLLRRADESPIPESITSVQAKRIELALAQYGIEVSVNEVRPGPTVTLYGLVPGWIRRQGQVRGQESDRRVTVDAILAREKDLALALAAPSLRFEAPVPGESLVGLEVPNPEPSLVTLGSLMASSEFSKAEETSRIPITLGKGSGGEVVTADLSQMPHLLIAGATGSGKSVMVNSILACLLMQFSPWDLRFIMIDPKRVELTHYNGIPHLVTPVVVEADRAVRVLRGAVLEMTHRLRLLEARGSRNIDAYNKKSEGPMDRMPYLVVVVDEMADLMMSAPNDIEQALCRLAQLGRATGIHLVVATQRPSVDVITGLIKANFPSRISFAVASQIDSRTILDSPGAEKLLGRGDMLHLPQEFPKPKRIQGAFISDEELARVVEFWEAQQGPNPPDIELEPARNDGNSDGDFREEKHDELLNEATELAQRYSRISTSLLQRRLRIGYPRAARLRDELEGTGVISGDGEVLFPRKGENE
jgi:S-DNA-T family DNA segregation ATPase FtsK/SpoIIIE